MFPGEEISLAILGRPLVAVRPDVPKASCLILAKRRASLSTKKSLIAIKINKNKTTNGLKKIEETCS